MVSVRFPVVALLPTFTVRVEVPEPLTDVGFKFAVTREPCPVTLRLTVPANPFCPVMVIVEVPDEPRAMVKVDGDAEMVKSGLGGGLTTSVTVVECVRLPLVPVIVKVKVPAGVVALVVTDMVDDPEPVTEAGLKLALAPAGNPLTLKLTLLANPPDPVTVAVYDVFPPAVTVAEAGVAEMEKSPTTGAFTTSVTVVVWLRVPLVPVMVNGKLPVGVVLAVVTVMVEEPEVVTEAGLKLAVAFAGSPPTLRLTVPVNPFVGLTVTV